MILSPVILNYLRVEMSKIEVARARRDRASQRLNESKARVRNYFVSRTANDNPWIDICPGIRAERSPMARPCTK